MLLLLLVACAPDPIVHPDRLSAWAEFAAVDDLPAYLERAGALELNVNLALLEGRHDREYLASACAEAEKREVALRLWPLLAEEDGYWANQANVEAFTDWTMWLAEVARRDCPRAEGFQVDLELPIDRTRTLLELIGGGGSVAELISFLVDGRDPEAFEEARAGYADLVAELREDGYLVSASTVAMVADDFADGDQSIAQALWTPVEGIDWDVVSFQVYRSTFDCHYAGALADPTQRFEPGLVSSYAASIRARFPESGGVGLGTTGSGMGTEEPLAGPEELQADLAAALAAGIPLGQLDVFSLDGLVDREDAAQWIAEPEPAEPEPDPATEELRALLAALDAAVE